MPGPTGHEDAVQDWTFDRRQSATPEVRRSRFNHRVARIGEAGPRVATMTRADDFCFMVTSIGDDVSLLTYPKGVYPIGHGDG